MLDPLDLALFDYSYPPEAIAQAPAQPRDASRLLHVPPVGEFLHRQFRDLPSLLVPGDLLVLNETRVLKARLHGVRVPSGGAVEVLVIGPAPEDPTAVRVLAKPARRCKAGTMLCFGSVQAVMLSPTLLRFDPSVNVRSLLEEQGEIPLPPYIHPPQGLDREQAYQTVFARVDGSVAAPTASLHFTDALLTQIEQKGIEIAKLVLEVGLGTFSPVRGSSLRDHIMHEEALTLPLATAQAIARTRKRGGRIIAIGTTVVRALESQADGSGGVRAGSGQTRMFITPGYTFSVVDALLTNFHVPRSTLLALVAAFAGRERILEAYACAVKEGYRLFSFGDVMFLEKE